MILQKIVINGDAPHELYFRGGSEERGSIALKSGESTSFDTYFNSFTYTKYRQYTTVRDLTFKARVSGSAEIRLYTLSHTKKSLVAKSAGSGEISVSVQLSDLPDDAFLYPEIEAEGCAIFLGGEYCTEANSKNISVAIAICTYRREEYLLRNLKILEESNIRFLDRIIVADNGNTLDASLLSVGKVRVFTNKNYGGSSGFTRGLIEAKRERFSHVILMDDDVVIFPDALDRMTAFVSLLKDEFKNAHLSAAMLKTSDIRYQHEKGARWNGSRIESQNADLNVTDSDSLLKNIEDGNIEYGAWWCFCLPISDIDEFGLPLPLFIKFDDVEYGMRCCKDAPIVTMSGMAVAHADFDFKYNIHLEYYTVRNQLIALSVHNKLSTLGCILRLIKVSAKHLFMYRYEAADIILRAFEDFLLGAGFIEKTDAEALNRSVMSMAPPSVSLESEEYDIERRKSEYRPKKRNPLLILLASLTLGSHLIPSFLLKNEPSYAPLSKAKVYDCFMRKRTIQYQIEGNSGYLFNRNARKFFAKFFRLIAMAAKIVFRFRRAKRSYQESFSRITSEEFWEEYLDIE